MSLSHLNQTLTRIVTSAYLGLSRLSRHIFSGPGGVHHLFKLHLQAIWLLLCGCHLRCWSDHMTCEIAKKWNMIFKKNNNNAPQLPQLTSNSNQTSILKRSKKIKGRTVGNSNMDAFVPACVGARPAQIWRFLDLLFFSSSNYVMLLKTRLVVGGRTRRGW